jgi:hypothetical protein
MSCPIIVPSLPAGYDMLQPALGTKVCELEVHSIAILEDVTGPLLSVVIGRVSTA